MDMPQPAVASTADVQLSLCFLFRLKETWLMLALDTMHTVLVFPASWQHYHGASPGYGPPANARTIHMLSLLFLLMRRQSLTCLLLQPTTRYLKTTQRWTWWTSFWSQTFVSGGELQDPVLACHNPPPTVVIAFWSHMVIPLWLGNFFGGYWPWRELPRPENMCGHGAPKNEALWLTPRGPSSHASFCAWVTLCVFALALPEACTASLFIFVCLLLAIRFDLLLMLHLVWHARQVKRHWGFLGW